MLLLVIIVYVLKPKKNQTEKKEKIYSETISNRKVIYSNLQPSVIIDTKIIENVEPPIIPELNKNSYVVFLNWINGKKVLNNDEYPVYFLYEYGIKNCREFHQKLIREGYLTQVSLEVFLKNKKVDELKQILEINKLKKTGKKDELIKRITENIDVSKIRIENGIYEISEKGTDFIKDCDYIIKLRKTTISIDEYEKEKVILGPKFSYNDIVWSIYNKRMLQFFNEKSFGLYRNTILEMANILFKERKYKDALSFFIIGLYCDLSGNGNSEYIEDKKDLFISELDIIYELKEYFTDEMLERCFKLKFPFHYCDEKIFKSILDDIFQDKSEEEILRKYKPKMKKKPKQEWED